MSVNKSMFGGHMARDPESHTFASGEVKVSFCVCVNNRKKNQDTQQWEDDPNWVDFEAYKDLGQRILQDYRQGDYILVDDARLKTDTWVDKNTQEKRSKIKFVANHVAFLPRHTRKEDRPASGNAEPAAAAAAPPAKAAPGGGKKASASGGKKAGKAQPQNEDDAVPAGVGDDDIPF